MSYSALYRKFRPIDFGQVRGQEHIVTTLKNQLKLGRIGHAYLFTGTRGTGKTTVAKILAKAVNCEHPTENGPCNECEMCREIQMGNSMNVIELDAASNNGVDNVREIVDAVQYSPAKGKYKVYIIDEVHMMSASAFNALLKTLEEPPSYVLFILATTEVHKIPITILSRCQRYDFHRISIDTIAGHMRSLCENEHVDAEEKALRYIAKAADGSMRDGLSLLDQCIAFYLGQKLSYENVLKVLGAVDTSVFYDMLSAVTQGNIPNVLKVIENIIINGRELTWFVNEFTWYLRNLLLLSTAADCEEMIEMSAENLEQLRKQADTVEAETLIRYIRILSELSSTLRTSGQKRVMTEIAFIKLCKPQMESDTGSIKERIRILEAQIEKLKSNPGVFIEADENEATSPRPAPGKEAERVILPSALDEDVREVARNWSDIVDMLPESVQKITKACTLSVSEGEECKLILTSSNPAVTGIMESENGISQIKKVIAKHIGKEMNISVRLLTAAEQAGGRYPDIERLMSNGVNVEIS